MLGRLDDAEASFRCALELRPDLAPPYANLGKLLEMRGRWSEAVLVYDHALARGVDPVVFSQYRAAVLGETTPRSPNEWVKATFDNFAPTFDSHLRSLGYEVPQRLAAMLATRLQPNARVLDLGCGTGLVGAALFDATAAIIGVDLSPRMIAQARARGVYAQLQVAEIHAFLAECSPGSFDAVVAADVFIYIGALEALFPEVARVLQPGGWLAFSIEESDTFDYKLLPTGRYAQSDRYIRRCAAEAFELMESVRATIRFEQGSPLPGRLYLLRRRGAAAPAVADTSAESDL
jgi:predicted TPR repeat methyltransferase